VVGEPAAQELIITRIQHTAAPSFVSERIHKLRIFQDAALICRSATMVAEDPPVNLPGSVEVDSVTYKPPKAQQLPDSKFLSNRIYS